MVQDAESERVRGYLLAQAERHDWAALWPRVIGPRVELLTEIASISEEQADFRPSPEAWSVRECLAHVLRASRGTLGRIEALAAGRTESPRPPETVASSFADLRAQLVADSARFAGVLDRIPVVPNLQLTAEHPVFGQLNARAWFLFQRLHDTDHLEQIRAIEAAPGYPSG